MSIKLYYVISSNCARPGYAASDSVRSKSAGAWTYRLGNAKVFTRKEAQDYINAYRGSAHVVMIKTMDTIMAEIESLEATDL